MGVFQPWHLIVVLVIILMVFGPGKLPQIGRAVGDSLREFRRATDSEPPNAKGVLDRTAAVPCGTCLECGAVMSSADRFCGSCGAHAKVGLTPERTGAL